MENSGRGRLMQFATEEVKFSRQFSELKENKESKDIYKKDIHRWARHEKIKLKFCLHI